MENIWKNFSNIQEIDIFLISCILLFTFTIILLISLVSTSRFKKIRKEIYHRKNTAHINKILFAIAFDGAVLKDFKDDLLFKRNWRRSLYKEQFLTELIKLSRLYGGEVALNLRKAYIEFRLIQLSFAKIRSRKWEKKCTGIQELGELEIKKAVPVIRKYTKSSNNTLKMVALIEVIHLCGLKGLSILENYIEPLNDWIQLNLLESIKKANISEVPDFGYLLKSANDTIVVFGLRLITLFNQSHHLPTVKSLQHTTSKKINMEARIACNKFFATNTLDTEESENIFLPFSYELNKQVKENSYNINVLLIVFLSALAIIVITVIFW